MQTENQNKKFLVSILALNIKGQLGRITTFFSENDLNVLRLVLSAADKNDKIHRTIAYLEGEEGYVDFMCKKLQNLDNVLKVTKFKTEDEYIEKEICLIKVLLSDPAIAKIVEILNSFKGKAIYTNRLIMIFKIEDKEENVNKIINNLTILTKKIEISRSGMVAMGLNDHIDDIIETDL